MISVQELGTSILSDSPSKFYIIGGQEYGVKDKYISKLERLYGEKFEYPTVISVIELMSKKHIIPLQPALYVVRYDETFVSQISTAIAEKIRRCKIIGTLVCVYSDTKHIEKLDKFLPEYVSAIDSVNPKFIEKYLHSDFPHLDDRSIKVAVNAASNYGHARNICKSMMYASPESLAKMDETKLASLFGCIQFSTDAEFQQGVAAKNFKYLVKLLDRYEGDLDSLIYTVLQTSLEMEKVLCSKYSNSELAKYSKNWTYQDCYYLFMNAYAELEKLRSNTSSNAYDSLIYLFGLLTFKNIPSVEAMNAI